VPASPVTAGYPAVFPDPDNLGWIRAWSLPSTDRSTPSLNERVDEWVTKLLAAISLPRSEMTWFAWNPFDLQLPSRWRDGAQNPLDPAWAASRVFHERLEIRIRRTPSAVQVRLLTEDEAVLETASALAADLLGAPMRLREERFQTVDGQVLLLGRPLPWQDLDGHEWRGEVRFPRLLRYEVLDPLTGANAAETDNDTGGRLRAYVTRYLDATFRLRAVRYRRIGT